jgi:hypothetical protein
MSIYACHAAEKATASARSATRSRVSPMTFDLQFAAKATMPTRLSASAASIRNEQTRSTQAAPRALEGEAHVSE